MMADIRWYVGLKGGEPGKAHVKIPLIVGRGYYEGEMGMYKIYVSENGCTISRNGCGYFLRNDREHPQLYTYRTCEESIWVSLEGENP